MPKGIGRGGSRVRTEPLSLTCKGCQESFEVTHCGRLPSLCPDCLEILRWCPKCERALPFGAFYASQKSGTPCIACKVRPQKAYVCGSCGSTFSRTDRGGSARLADRVHLCDQCEAVRKWCPRCDRVLDLEEFSLTTGKRSGRAAHCKDCHRAKYRQANKLERVVKKYGMTIQDWKALYEAQGGNCAICSGPLSESPRGPQVDHCHDTDSVRGILCTPCNITLGQMKDDPVRLRAAADYLELHARHLRPAG